MDTQRLKGFLAVARYGSFSRAAEKTFRTQPAVSLQIRSLENELKTKLFDRLNPRKIVLTDAGKALLDLASPLFDEIDTLKSRFNETCGRIGSSTLTIATHSSVMTYLLPDIIRAFKKKLSDCRLSIVSRGRKDIISMVNDGEAEIGITSLSTVPPVMDYRVFRRFNRMLIARKGHPLSKKHTIRPEDIATYPLLVPPLGGNTRMVIDEVFKKHGLKYMIAMEIAGREAVKPYVEMDLGVSIINEYYLDDEDRGKFFVKDVSRDFGSAERGIITKKNRHLPKPAKEFISILLNHFK